MTRIAHISDNHGWLYHDFEDADIIVHSGDFLPNSVARGHGPVKQEIQYQTRWLIDNKDALKAWIKDKQFLFCRGNHDFMNPVPLMQKFGIDAIDITEDIYWVDDLAFYGFPYIPWTGGGWSQELLPPEMSTKLDTVVKYINDGMVNVLVAHCPIYGILDKGHQSIGQRWGNNALKTAFDYKIKTLPKALLCGHVHEDHGMATYPPDPKPEDQVTIISNAATTVHFITI